eukprot:COSAG01_NODE_8579_length_2731_cov_34.444909_2_plen_102_part_00
MELGDFYAGQVGITRTLLSVTATKARVDLQAAKKEAAETEQHRAEAVAEIESLREQLGAKTAEFNEEHARRRAIEAERDTLWLPQEFDEPLACGWRKRRQW